MGAVYYSIAALPPEYRSQLENILIPQIHNTALQKNSDGEWQNDLLFSPLIDHIRDLGVNGVFINVNGEEKRLYFIAPLIVGDNLGINSIFGFTTSFSNTQCCRICTADGLTMSSQTVEDLNLLRTPEDHEIDVRRKTNGVKGDCIFNGLTYFNCIENSSLDKTHDFDEGGNRYVMGFILRELIVVKKKNFH